MENQKATSQYHSSVIYETRISKTQGVLERLISNKQNAVKILQARFRKVVQMIIFANRSIEKHLR